MGIEVIKEKEKPFIQQLIANILKGAGRDIVGGTAFEGADIVIVEMLKTLVEAENFLEPGTGYNRSGRIAGLLENVWLKAWTIYLEITLTEKAKRSSQKF